MSTRFDAQDRDYLDPPNHGAIAYHAVLRNLAVIGEAMRALPGDFKAQRPDTPWASVEGLRNIVIHEYFRVNLDLIRTSSTTTSPSAETLRSLEGPE